MLLDLPKVVKADELTPNSTISTANKVLILPQRVIFFRAPIFYPSFYFSCFSLITDTKYYYLRLILALFRVVQFFLWHKLVCDILTVDDDNGNSVGNSRKNVSTKCTLISLYQHQQDQRRYLKQLNCRTRRKNYEINQDRSEPNHDRRPISNGENGFGDRTATEVVLK